MSKEQRLYCKIGQAVCNISSAIMFMAFPMGMVALGGYIASLILG